jgi:hypothetical protein
MATTGPAADFDVSDSTLPWLPITAFLLAGVLTAALVTPSMLAEAHSPAGTAWRAAVLVLLVAIVTTIVARLTFVTFTPCPDEWLSEFALLCGAVSVWLVPVVVLAAQRRFWAVPTAVLLGLAAARLIRKCAQALGEPTATKSLPTAGSFMFAGCDSASFSRGLAYPVAAAVAMEAGLITLLAERTAIAALLVGGGTFLLGLRVPATTPPQLPASPWRLWIRFATRTLFAIALTLLVLIRLPGSQEDQVFTRKKSAMASSGGRLADNNLLAGVILLADTSRGVRLTVPVPRRSAAHRSLRALRATAIEFSGVYWIFTVPQTRPPKSSMIVRATPITYNFTTVDRTPLIMQAHQQLPWPIDLRCCSAVEVTVCNADKQPGTIALEVEFATNDLRKALRQSLGVQQVPKVGTAVLRFSIPERPALVRFDRIIVNFQLGGRRIHRSANVAIERFFLIPRTR